MESLPKFLLNKYRLQIGIFLIAAIVVGGGVLALATSDPETSEIERISGAKPSISEPREATASPTIATLLPKIKIDIAGAVINPGVYELSENARVEDALNAAGGLSEEADRDWVAKNLNLATKLSDGDKIYIPKVGETSSASSAISGGSVPPSAGTVSGAGTSTNECDRVNINTASAGTLADCLSGIGVTKAQSIIKYREDHGGFKSIEEIKEVSGIAEGTFAKIKDQIVVD